jgi:hypothetical protein
MTTKGPVMSEKAYRKIADYDSALAESKREIAKLRLRIAADKAEIERLRRALGALYGWYDRDGSVGEATAVFEHNRRVLALYDDH